MVLGNFWYIQFSEFNYTYLKHVQLQEPYFRSFYFLATFLRLQWPNRQVMRDTPGGTVLLNSALSQLSALIKNDFFHL